MKIDQVRHLEMLCRKSFDCNSIPWKIRPQIDREGAERHLSDSFSSISGQMIRLMFLDSQDKM